MSGATSISLQGASVTTQSSGSTTTSGRRLAESTTQASTHVVVRGTTTLFGQRARARALLHHSKGKVRMVMELYREHDANGTAQAWDLHSIVHDRRSHPPAGHITGAFSRAQLQRLALPNITAGAALVLSTHTASHAVSEGGHGTAQLQRGLNIVAKVPAHPDHNAALASLLAGATPEEGTAGHATTTPLGAIQDLPQFNNNSLWWFAATTMPLRGTLRPSLSASIALPDTLRVARGLVQLSAARVHLPSASEADSASTSGPDRDRMTLECAARVTIPGLPANQDYTIPMRGTLRNNAYQLDGSPRTTHGALWLGASPGATPGVALEDAALRIVGGRGGIGGSAATSSATLTGNIMLARVAVPVKLALPGAAHKTALANGAQLTTTVLPLGAVSLDEHVHLDNLKLTLADGGMAAATADLSLLPTSSSDDALVVSGATVQLKGNGSFAIAASLPSGTTWDIQVDKLTAAISDLALSISGPARTTAAARSRDSGILRPEFRAAVTGTTTVAGVAMAAEMVLDTTATAPKHTPASVAGVARVPLAATSTAAATRLKSTSLEVLLTPQAGQPAITLASLLAATVGTPEALLTAAGAAAAQPALDAVSGLTLGNARLKLVPVPTVADDGSNPTSSHSLAWGLLASGTLASAYGVPSSTAALSVRQMPGSSSWHAAAAIDLGSASVTVDSVVTAAGLDTTSLNAAVGSLTGATVVLSTTAGMWRNVALSGPGLTLSAAMQLSALEHRLASTNAWAASRAKAATVPARLHVTGATLSTLALTASLPTALPTLASSVTLGPGATVTISAPVTASTNAATYQLSAPAATIPASPAAQSAVTCATPLVAALGDTSYTAQCTLGSWILPTDAAAAGIAVANGATLTVTATRTDGSSGVQVSASANMAATLSFTDLGVTVAGAVELGASTSSAVLPVLTLANGVTFTPSSVTGGSGQVTIAGLLSIDQVVDGISTSISVTSNALAVAGVAGSTTRTAYLLSSPPATGDASVSATFGGTAEGIALTASGASANPVQVSGTASGDFDFLGLGASSSDVTCTIALPLTGSPACSLPSATPLQLATGLQLKGGSVAFQTGAIADSLLEVQTSMAADAVTMPATGTVTPSGYTLTGARSEPWVVDTDRTLTDVGVQVTDGTGTLTGDWETASGTSLPVEMEVPAAFTQRRRLASVSVPSLRLSPQLVVTDAQIDGTALTGTAVLTTGLATPLSMPVTGTTSGTSDYSISGTASSWTIEVGSQGITATSVALSFSSSTGGSLTADVDLLGTASHTLTVALPAATSTTSWPLDAAGGAPALTLSALASSLFGSAALSTTVQAPSALKSQVVGETITATSIAIDTTGGAAQFKVLGTLSMASLSASTPSQVSFVAAQQGGSAWSFVAGVRAPGAFAFSALVPAVTGLDSVPFTDGGFFLAYGASALSDVALPGSGDAVVAPSVAANKATVVGVVALSHLSGNIGELATWSAGSASTAIAVGSFGTDASTLAVAAELPGKLTIGKHVTVWGSASLQLVDGTTAPSYALTTTSATITLSSEFPAVHCDEAAVESSGSLAFTCSASEYKISVGSGSFDATGVSASVAWDGSTFSGTVTGSVQMGEAAMTLSVKLPVDDESPHGAEIDFELKEGDTVTFAEALSSAHPGLSLDLSEDFKEVLSFQVSELSMQVVTVPPSLTMSTTMQLFRIPDPVTVEMMAGKDDDNKAVYGIGIGVQNKFKLKDILSSIPDIELVDFEFSSAGVVLTNTDDPWTFSIPGTEGIEAHDGYAMQMVTPLDQGVLKPVFTWADLDDVTMRVAYTEAQKDLRFSVALGVGWDISSSFSVAEVEAFMDIGGPEKLDVGLSLELDTKICGADVTWETEVKLALESILFAVTEETAWKNPCGATGVSLGPFSVEMGIAYETLLPDSLKIGGTVTVGDVTGSGAILVDEDELENTVIAFSLTNFNLLKLLDAVTGVTVPSGFGRVLAGVSFEELAFSYNGAEFPQTIDGTVYPDGTRVTVKQMSLFDGFLLGSAELQLDDEDFYMKASINPIEIGPRGSLLSIHGYHCTSCKASFEVGVGKRFRPPSAHMSVSASVLDGVLEADGQVSITDEGVLVELHYTEGVISASLALKSPSLSKPNDMSIAIEYDDDLSNYINTKVLAMLKEAREAADHSIDDAQAKVDSWERDEQPKIAKLRQDIAQRRAELEVCGEGGYVMFACVTTSC